MNRWVGMVVVAALVAGCRSNSSLPAPVPARAVVGEWLVAAMNGHPVADIVPTIKIEAGGAVSGRGGVNSYSSRVDPVRLSGGGFRLDPIISTEMAGSSEANAVEREFFAALRAVSGFTAANDTAELIDSSGTTLVSLNRRKIP